MVNVTNYFQNVSDFQDILQVANDQTGGWAYLGIMIMIFAVLTVSFLGYGFEIALITGAFISLIIGMFFVYMELLSWGWLMLFFGIILIVIFYITWTNRKNA